MKFNTLVLAATLLLTASLTAPTLAEETDGQSPRVFVGVNVSKLEYSEEGYSDNPEISALIGRIGVKFNDYTSLEFRAGTGTEEAEIFNGAGSLDLDNMKGAYLRLGVTADDVIFPYVILGYTRGELTATARGYYYSPYTGYYATTYAYSAEESDVSFGLGLDIHLGSHAALNLEYMRYLDKEGVEISGPSLGLAVRF